MAQEDREEPIPRFFAPTRTIAFTDGVFAIVITILVLGIEAPSTLLVSTAEFEEIRTNAAHQLWLYFVSFCIVGSYWIQHTVLFGSLRSIDRPMTVLNLLYLLPVTLLPFVTQVIGAHRNAWWGVALFGGVNLAAIFIYSLAWAHAARHLGPKEGSSIARLGRSVAPKLALFSAVIIEGVVVSTVDIGAGISVFLLMPAIFVYNYLRAPEQSR
jgi:TMEM175 potassium channel family protein